MKFFIITFNLISLGVLYFWIQAGIISQGSFIILIMLLFLFLYFLINLFFILFSKKENKECVLKKEVEDVLKDK